MARFTTDGTSNFTTLGTNEANIYVPYYPPEYQIIPNALEVNEGQAISFNIIQQNPLLNITRNVFWDVEFEPLEEDNPALQVLLTFKDVMFGDTVGNVSIYVTDIVGNIQNTIYTASGNTGIKDWREHQVYFDLPDNQFRLVWHYEGPTAATPDGTGDYALDSYSLNYNYVHFDNTISRLGWVTSFGNSNDPAVESYETPEDVLAGRNRNISSVPFNISTGLGGFYAASETAGPFTGPDGPAFGDSYLLVDTSGSSEANVASKLPISSWLISPVLTGRFGTNDFVEASGRISIVDNNGIITIRTIADNLLEGPESFRVVLRSRVTSEALAYSANVTLNDTSVGLPELKEAVFTNTGWTQWIVPIGVTSISFVALSAGADGSYISANAILSKAGRPVGGGGGGCYWRNNISVTPGETLLIHVGQGNGGRLDGASIVRRINGGQNKNYNAEHDLGYVSGAEGELPGEPTYINNNYKNDTTGFDPRTTGVDRAFVTGYANDFVSQYNGNTPEGGGQGGLGGVGGNGTTAWGAGGGCGGYCWFNPEGFVHYNDGVLSGTIASRYGPGDGVHYLKTNNFDSYPIVFNYTGGSGAPILTQPGATSGVAVNGGGNHLYGILTPSGSVYPQIHGNNHRLSTSDPNYVDNISYGTAKSKVFAYPGDYGREMATFPNLYGGGGSCLKDPDAPFDAGANTGISKGRGGNGAVRIVWPGLERQFPRDNVYQVSIAQNLKRYVQPYNSEWWIQDLVADTNNDMHLQFDGVHYDSFIQTAITVGRIIDTTSNHSNAVVVTKYNANGEIYSNVSIDATNSSLDQKVSSTLLTNGDVVLAYPTIQQNNDYFVTVVCVTTNNELRWVKKYTKGTSVVLGSKNVYLYMGVKRGGLFGIDPGVDTIERLNSLEGDVVWSRELSVDEIAVNDRGEIAAFCTIPRYSILPDDLRATVVKIYPDGDLSWAKRPNDTPTLPHSFGNASNVFYKTGGITFIPYTDEILCGALLYPDASKAVSSNLYAHEATILTTTTLESLNGFPTASDQAFYIGLTPGTWSSGNDPSAEAANRWLFRRSGTGAKLFDPLKITTDENGTVYAALSSAPVWSIDKINESNFYKMTFRSSGTNEQAILTDIVPDIDTYAFYVSGYVRTNSSSKWRGFLGKIPMDDTKGEVPFTGGTFADPTNVANVCIIETSLAPASVGYVVKPVTSSLTSNKSLAWESYDVRNSGDGFAERGERSPAVKADIPVLESYVRPIELQWLGNTGLGGNITQSVTTFDSVTNEYYLACIHNDTGNALTSKTESAGQAFTNAKVRVYKTNNRGDLLKTIEIQDGANAASKIGGIEHRNGNLYMVYTYVDPTDAVVGANVDNLVLSINSNLDIINWNARIIGDTDLGARDLSLYGADTLFVLAGAEIFEMTASTGAPFTRGATGSSSAYQYDDVSNDGRYVKRHHYWFGKYYNGTNFVSSTPRSKADMVEWVAIHHQNKLDKNRTDIRIVGQKVDQANGLVVTGETITMQTANALVNNYLVINGMSSTSSTVTQYAQYYGIYNRSSVSSPSYIYDPYDTFDDYPLRAIGTISGRDEYNTQTTVLLGDVFAPALTSIDDSYNPLFISFLYGRPSGAFYDWQIRTRHTYSIKAIELVADVSDNNSFYVLVKNLGDNSFVVSRFSIRATTNDTELLKPVLSRWNKKISSTLGVELTGMALDDAGDNLIFSIADGRFFRFATNLDQSDPTFDDIQMSTAPDIWWDPSFADVPNTTFNKNMIGLDKRGYYVESYIRNWKRPEYRSLTSSDIVPGVTGNKVYRTSQNVSLTDITDSAETSYSLERGQSFGLIIAAYYDGERIATGASGTQNRGFSAPVQALSYNPVTEETWVTWRVSISLSAQTMFKILPDKTVSLVRTLEHGNLYTDNTLESDIGGNTFSAAYILNNDDVGLPEFGGGFADLIVSKYDPLGNKTFEKIYGTSGSETSLLTAVNNEGGIVLAMRQQPAGTTDYNGVLVYLGSSGNVLWEQTFYTGTTFINDVAVSPKNGDVYVLCHTGDYLTSDIFVFSKAGKFSYHMNFRNRHSLSLKFDNNGDLIVLSLDKFSEGGGYNSVQFNDNAVVTKYSVSYNGATELWSKKVALDDDDFAFNSFLTLLVIERAPEIHITTNNDIWIMWQDVWLDQFNNFRPRIVFSRFRSNGLYADSRALYRTKSISDADYPPSTETDPNQDLRQLWPPSINTILVRSDGANFHIAFTDNEHIEPGIPNTSANDPKLDYCKIPFSETGIYFTAGRRPLRFVDRPVNRDVVTDKPPGSAAITYTSNNISEIVVRTRDVAGISYESQEDPRTTVGVYYTLPMSLG